VSTNFYYFKKMPVVLGEVDVLKSILLLPFTNAGEGASEFNVRGGGADQNLILLGNVFLFHNGFLVFQSDAIKDLKLYKANTSALRRSCLFSFRYLSKTVVQ
jgi:hypothetical protein